MSFGFWIRVIKVLRPPHDHYPGVSISSSIRSHRSTQCRYDDRFSGVELRIKFGACINGDTMTGYQLMRHFCSHVSTCKRNSPRDLQSTSNIGSNPNTAANARRMHRQAIAAAIRQQRRLGKYPKLANPMAPKPTANPIRRIPCQTEIS